MPQSIWNQSWRISSAVFVMALAPQNKFSLFSEFSRYLRSMPKTSTQVVSTLRKHTTGFIGKSLRECSGSTVLAAACYCLLAVWSLYFRSEIVYVSVESNHNRTPWELHSDNGVRRGHHSYTLCEVALLVAKSMKAHTIAESLIMPAAKILVRCVMGEESVVKLESVSVPIIRPGTLDRRSKDWARLTGNTQDRRNVRPAVHNTVRNNDEKYYFLTRPPFIFLRSQPWWTTFSF